MKQQILTYSKCPSHIERQYCGWAKRTHAKEHLRNFLSETFYKPYYMAPEEDIDLAIRLDKTIKSNIGLLIEVKSTTNKVR